MKHHARLNAIENKIKDDGEGDGRGVFFPVQLGEGTWSLQGKTVSSAYLDALELAGEMVVRVVPASREEGSSDEQAG